MILLSPKLNHRLSFFFFLNLNKEPFHEISKYEIFFKSYFIKIIDNPRYLVA